MDGQRFDGLAKRVAGTADRRKVLGGLGALALGSIGLLQVTNAEAAQVGAEDKRRRCRDRCEDLYCAGWADVDVTKERRCLRVCRKQCNRHHRDEDR
jgi:hypothetical protein